MSHIQFDGVAISASLQSNLLFPPFTQAISREVVGLVGRNGCGKSTLLAAIASRQPPAKGSIRVDGSVEIMPQGALPSGWSIARALGIAEAWERIARIERGDAQSDDLERADWTLPGRVEEALFQLGLSDLDLEREAAELSGGQQARVKLAGMILAQPDILLLDEPTNDLDDEGRKKVVELLQGWKGTALVASHDRELLEFMDRIIELSKAGVLSVGGGWSAFKRQRDAERMQAQADLEDAKTRARKARSLHQARQERQAQRSRQGRNSSTRRDASRLEINASKARAERTASRGIALGREQIDQAREAASTAAQRVERVVPVRIELPSSELQRAHRLVEAREISCVFGQRAVFGPLDLSITGPERIELTGRNGSGKSSLIKVLTGAMPASSGSVLNDPRELAVLDQHLSLLLPEESALDAMRRCNPALAPEAAHAALAQYGFRAAWGERLVGTLSGGERVKLALACLFSAATPPKMLILDEPTNHLDLDAIELLEQALLGFDGAILCVSHDSAFRRALRLGRRFSMDEV